jgi:hypothetical protein
VNSAEAKRILIACRPGTDDLRAPDAVAALEFARRDPVLRQWWQQQQKFHEQAQSAFQDIPVPPQLRDQILFRAKILKLPWWRNVRVLGAAAAVIILLPLVGLWPRSSHESSFETFRARMVRNVLRQYRMDVVTNDMAQIRQFLATNKAPADYTLRGKLPEFLPTGAGVMSWRDQRVSMVCLDGGQRGTLFLFVVDRHSVNGAPAAPAYAHVNELGTVSWSDGDKAYVLAGKNEQTWLEKIP